MSTFDEELREIYGRCDISNNQTQDPITEDQFVQLISALIKKHQPERKEPSGYDMMFEYDYYNEALDDSDKAYGLEDKRLPIEWRHSNED